MHAAAFQGIVVFHIKNVNLVAKMTAQALSLTTYDFVRVLHSAKTYEDRSADKTIVRPGNFKKLVDEAEMTCAPDGSIPSA